MPRMRLVMLICLVFLVGCTTTVAGSGRAISAAQGQSDTKLLEPISTGLEGVLALSASGHTLVLESAEFGLCAVLVDATALTDADACAGIDEGAPSKISYVEFSPDGSKAAVWRDMTGGFKGGAWLFDLTSGLATAIPLPTLPGYEEVNSEYSSYEYLAWDGETGDLLGVGYYSYIFDVPNRFVRIDPATAMPTVIDPPIPGDEYPSGPFTAVAGGAGLSFFDSDFNLRPVWVDFDDGSWTELVKPQADSSSDSPGDFLLDVSPSGGTALIHRTEEFTHAIIEVDIASGQTKRWKTDEDLFIFTATYSPDGAEILVLMGIRSASELHLRRYAVDGTQIDDYLITDLPPGDCEMHWATDQLVTLSPPTGLSGPVGWMLPE